MGYAAFLEGWRRAGFLAKLCIGNTIRWGASPQVLSLRTGQRTRPLMAFSRSCSNRPGRCSLLLVAAIAFGCFCTSGLTAQQPSWTLAGPAFSASVADIQAEAAKVKPEPFMEATVFYERDSYQIAASGAVTLRHSLLYRIESQNRHGSQSRDPHPDRRAVAENLLAS